MGKSGISQFPTASSLSILYIFSTMLASKGTASLRRIAVFFLAVLVSAVVFRRFSSWWTFWTNHEPQENAPLHLEHVFQENIEIGQIESNCGLRLVCDDDSFPVYLSTGYPEDLSPQLCVSGKYVLQRGVNGGGRGLNAAVLEPSQFQVVSVRNFDTYNRDSALEVDNFLDQILDDDILIIFTTDEASARLNHSTKVMLNNLGSGKIQDLSFRAQWYLITQKRGKGFSVLEKLTYPRNKSWGDRLEFRGCVPSIIRKEPVTIDPPARDTSARDKFCEGKFLNIYQPICTQTRFENVLPALLTNRSLIGSIVFSAPVYVQAGNDFEVLVAVLDSLVHQPGVLVSGITVLYNSSQKHVPDLLEFFNVKGRVLTAVFSWEEMIAYARADANQHKIFMVIAADCIPSPDFLFFMAQTVASLLKDASISAISAWSTNCYHSSGDVHAAYRVHDSPKFGALFRVDDVRGDIIVPDVSRIQGPVACHAPSLEADNWIERPQDLTQERYFHKLVILQQRSVVLNVTTVLKNCSRLYSENSYVVYFEENPVTLAKLLNCLGVVDGLVGQYQKLFRVSVETNASFLLINSNSSFYKARPIHS